MKRFSIVRLIRGLIAVVCVAYLGWRAGVATSRQEGKLAPAIRVKLAPRQQGSIDTLVLYTFAASDPEYQANFEYFLRYGVGGDNVFYAFILQQMSEDSILSMPELPKRAKYIHHKNECFDWGTFGWAIRTKQVDIGRYKYIIFLNSSVRGPFVPPYWPDGTQASIHWTSIYTGKLGPKVKLVGSTINCQPVWWRSDPSKELRHNPHVQSYVMATDQVGMKVLMEEGKVFGCYENLLDTVWYSEVGASKAILDAGYSLDSLMLKYQGSDWSNKATWKCNDWQNPYADFAYDGVMINPFEVLFVKVKSYQLESDWITSKMAVTYDRWRQSVGNDSESNNHSFDKARFSYFLSKGITMSMRGRKCFDIDYYTTSNPDMPPETCTWDHFITQGQFEGRPFRFTCDNEFSYPAKEVLKEATIVARKAISQVADLAKQAARHADDTKTP